MYDLSGFWHAAARYSGRVDFSLLHRQDPSDWSPQQRENANLPAPLRGHHPRQLCNDRPIPISEPRYPQRLACIPFAPPVLFCRGNLELLHAPCVAMVGARRCTSQGRQMARQLAAQSVQAGLVVVSGMARGIDTAVHDAAAGRTIAVLGHALDARLSVGSRQKMDTIVRDGGLLISEFPPATPPARHTFPIRNRIIAWLGMATVVVEAGIQSGSLITARAALDAGRAVYAVPGNPLNPQAKGCLSLIEHGIPMVCSGSDLLRHLGHAHPDTNPITNPLLQCIKQGANLDELLAQLDMAPAELIRQLAALELDGIVERMPGDRYVLRQQIHLDKAP